MNISSFNGTKVDDDQHGLTDVVFKVVDAMGVTPREKVELAAYEHKDVAQVWFN